MRLRVSVQRHRLPPANVLWSVPANASSQAYTISRLLEDVNTILPLEAEHWGLEDYVVEVGGFECLHFTPVAQALRDDDELVIRPLLTAEVRSRTLSGRYQISGAGQHLVDGVPFGKPCLRPPTGRPQIRIPPCKRPRLLEDTMDGAEEEGATGLITANGETPPAETLSKSRYNAVNNPPAHSRHSRQEKEVHFDDVVDYDEAASDEEDDDDFDPNEAEVSSDMSLDDDASEGSGSNSSVSTSDSDSDSDTDSSSSGSESESSTDSQPDILPSKPALTPATAPARLPNSPYKGSKSTKARNDRRTLASKRRMLVACGMLPPNSTLEDTRQLLKQEDNAPDADITDATAQAQKPSNKRKRSGNAVAPEEQLQAGDELERRRRVLLAQLNIESASPGEAVKSSEQGESSEVVQQPSTGERAPKRLRPNVAAIRRIIAHQATPLKKPSPKPQPAPVEQPQVTPDPDFWKSKINYSAFECWNEELELTAPPFPFVQRWDRQTKRMSNQSTAEMRESLSPEEVTNGDADTTELDYGDPSTSTISTDTDKPETDTAAAIESQLRQDLATAAKANLPPLPEDIAALPNLSEADLKAGAIVVFKTFDLNNMTPEISGYKTAVIEASGDDEIDVGAIRLRLAERDVARKEKKVDKNGNRIYDRADYFQMEGSDEEDAEEDDIAHHAFSELLEAKLLKASA